MKKLILNLVKHPLISGSSILFLGSMGGNFFHFLFNLFMSRSLSVSDYGILASVLSLTTLPSLLYSAITPTVVSFAAMYFAKQEMLLVHGLFIKINRFAVSIGLLFFLLFALFSSQLGAFLHITNTPYLIVLGGVMVLIGFISIVNISFIQAKLSFHFLSFLNFLTGFLKFLVGVILVFLGFGVGGALGAILISGITIYIISFFPIRFIFHKSGVIPPISFREILGFAFPATISLLSITCFITVDILLTKHFFSPEDAGLYAGLALIGKVIFFFSSPIGMAMFPLIVHRREKNQNYHSIFNFSLLLVLIPSLLMTGFYYLFPSFTVQFFLKNKEYLQIANILWIYGIYMTLYSLLSVMTNYFLSIKETRIAFPLLIGASAQAVLLWYYHDNFIQVLLISIAIVSILLIILFIHYFIIYEQKK